MLPPEPVDVRPEPVGRPTVAVVVGAGLIGASVGCALTAAGYAVHLQDRQLSHARVAAGLGAGTVEPAEPDRVELVVVAVSPDALPRGVGASPPAYPPA